MGDFALKSIRRPLTVYNVLATKAADKSPLTERLHVRYWHKAYMVRDAKSYWHKADKPAAPAFVRY